MEKILSIDYLRERRDRLHQEQRDNQARSLAFPFSGNLETSALFKESAAPEDSIDEVLSPRRRFEEEVEKASQIKDNWNRESALIAAARLAYTSALDLKDRELRELAVRTIVNEVGVRKAATLTRGWKFIYELEKKQNPKD